MFTLTEQLNNVDLRKDSLLENVQSLNIPDYRVVRDKSGAKFVVYIVRLRSGDVAWELQRRYNEFRQLHDQLCAARGISQKLPTLPPKRMFGGFSKDFLEKRRADLEQYLQTLVYEPALLTNDLVRDFLWHSHKMLSAHASSSRPTDVRVPQQQQQQQQQGSTNAVSVAGSNEVTSPHKPVMSSQAGHGSPGQRSDPVPMHLGNPNSLGDINFHDVDDILDFEGNGDGLSEDEGVGSSDNEAMSRDTFPTGNEQQINSNNNVSNGNFAHPGSNQLYVNTQGNNGSEQVPNPSSARSIGSTSASQSEASSTPTGKKPSLEDFEMVRVLGKGSFGKVLLCRKRDSGKLYAIKVLKKQHVVKRRQVVHTKTERSVLGLVDHPFVVKLHYAFQTGDKLHFVLDFCSGGELFFHLGRAGRFSENLGRFYAAEIALALGHLHKKGVVYRDLKPENILLDSEGHIKLADFGLSKEGIVSGIKGTHSFCGTPEYLAPEVLNRKGHGTSVDWWSLGALLYEMLTGLPPWYSQDRQKMFACIRSSDLRFPDFVSSLAQLILTDFLERDVTKRLGSVRDVDDVKEHPFFQFMDWDKLYRREIPSPFVPRLNSQTDTANFDTQFTRLPINSIDASSFVGSPRNPHMLSSSVMSESQTHFDNFTYAEPSTLSANMQEIGSLQGGHMAYQPQVHVGSLAATSHSPAMNGLSNNGLSGGLLFD